MSCRIDAASLPNFGAAWETRCYTMLISRPVPGTLYKSNQVEISRDLR